VLLLTVAGLFDQTLSINYRKFRCVLVSFYICAYITAARPNRGIPSFWRTTHTNNKGNAEKKNGPRAAVSWLVGCLDSCCGGAARRTNYGRAQLPLPIYDCQNNTTCCLFFLFGGVYLLTVGRRSARCSAWNVHIFGGGGGFPSLLHWTSFFFSAMTLSASHSSFCALHI
jgi:hypothetical protein